MANLPISDYSQNTVGSSKEELLRRLFERLFSLMKEIRRGTSPGDPPLSPQQARLLFLVARGEGSGLSAKELASAAGITPGAVSQYVDLLAARRLITREEDPSDRRSVKLKLTPEGSGRVIRFKKDFFESLARRFDSLSVEELKEFVRLVDKVAS